MPEFPMVSGGAVRTAGATAGTSSAATTVTASASAHTIGSEQELIAATEFDANWIQVQQSSVSSGTQRYLTSIRAGSATGTTIIANIPAVSRGVGMGPNHMLFPCFIPKGTRISAVTQASAAGSLTIECAVTLFSGTHIASGGGSPWVATYGADTSTTEGTNIDAGATPDTDSTWVQMTASTIRDHRWLGMIAKCGDGSIGAAINWRFGIGVGSSTKVLIPDIHVSTDTDADLAKGAAWYFPCFVPAGTDLRVKVRSSSGTDGDRDVWVILYGAG